MRSTYSELLHGVRVNLGLQESGRLIVLESACGTKVPGLECVFPERVRRFPTAQLNDVACMAGPDDLLVFEPFAPVVFHAARSSAIASGRCQAHLVADCTALGVLPIDLPDWLDFAYIFAGSDGDSEDAEIFLSGTDQVAPARPELAQGVIDFMNARAKIAANIARWLPRSPAVESVLYPMASDLSDAIARQWGRGAPQSVRLSIVLSKDCPMPSAEDFAANQILDVRPPMVGARSWIALVEGQGAGNPNIIHLHVGCEDEDDIWEDIDRIFYGLERRCQNNSKRQIKTSGRSAYVN